MSLSEDSLREYRRLKANASVLAVAERQSLETLLRDEKTSGRLLAGLKERSDDLEEKRAKLAEDCRIANDRKTEVRLSDLRGYESLMSIA
jgi:structural maintenance of chromosome 1